MAAASRSPTIRRLARSSAVDLISSTLDGNSTGFLTRSCSLSTSSGDAGQGKARAIFRKAIPIALLSITGGVVLSAVNDLAIFHGCSSKAIERASQNAKVVEALGEPIVRGPWYDASLAVGQRRHSVSCTFPVSGPQGTGIFQLKAIRSGEETWFSFLRHNDWDILIMEALLHVPSNDEKHQTYRVSVLDRDTLPIVSDCKDCQSSELGSSEKPTTLQ